MNAGSSAGETEQTLSSLFCGALERFSERVAIVTDDAEWTYGEIVAQADQLAEALSGMGVTAGTPVALAMSNRAEYLLADLALIRAGAAKVPLNDLLAKPEIEFILRDSGAVVAIVDAGMLPAVHEAAAPQLRTIIGISSGALPSGVLPWSEVLARTPVPATPAAAPTPGDTGLIIYTGGTTGRQKGVVHTQRGLTTNLLSHLIELSLGDEERVLLTSPLPHSAGFLAQTALLKGATVFLETRFDPGRVLDRIQRDRITFTFMVPTMIYRVLDSMERRTTDVSSLRTLLYGAAPITLERLEQGLRLLGPVFVQLYGQSEAPNFLTRLRREDHTLDRPHLLTSCGQSVLMAEVDVRDTHGRSLPPGKAGEIVAHAPYVMSGYHGLPDTSAETLRDGWLHTGDIGRIDPDGYVYLLDRANDVIITGGMNVYGTEVENVLAEYPGIKQVAVVGIPHPDWGEAVVAFVVDDIELDQAAVAGYCRCQLAAYKCPKAIRRLAELPTTAYGKIDKRSLRAEWQGWSPHDGA